MKKHSRIQIKSVDGTLTEVIIDGHPIHGVRSMKLTKKGCKIPVLTLDLNALDIEIDSLMLVKQKGYGELDFSFKDGRMIFERS